MSAKDFSNIILFRGDENCFQKISMTKLFVTRKWHEFKRQKVARLENGIGGYGYENSLGECKDKEKISLERKIVLKCDKSFKPSCAADR